MLYDNAIVYLAAIDWLDSAIYIGTKTDIDVIPKNFQKKEYYNTLESALEFCRTQQGFGPPADKHIMIYDLENKITDNYADYANRHTPVKPWVETAAVCTLEAAFMTVIQNHQNALDERDKEKNTLFHLAAQKGFVHALEFLSTHMRRLINARNISNETPLHCAALRPHVNAIEYLLSQSVNVSMRSSNNLPSSFRCQSALGYLLNAYDGNNPPQNIVFQLTFAFMMTEHAGLEVYLAKKDKTYSIREIKIKKEKFSAHRFNLDPAYNTYFENNKIKPGYEIRHKKSVASLIPTLEKKWQNIPIGTLPAEDQRHFRKVCEYIKHDVHNTINAKDNLFVGSKIENQAFGWLISALSKCAPKVKRGAMKKPHAVTIPKKYRPVFASHPAYQALSEKYFDRTAHVFNISCSSYGRFYHLAHNDNPDLADFADRARKTFDWLANVLNTQHAKIIQTKGDHPHEVAIPKPYWAIFANHPACQGLTPKYIDNTGHVLKLWGRSRGAFYQLAHTYHDANALSAQHATAPLTSPEAPATKRQKISS